MIHHLHVRRDGEAKLTLELTFEGEKDCSFAWEQLRRYFAAATSGKSAQITMDPPPKTVTFQRKMP